MSRAAKNIDDELQKNLKSSHGLKLPPAPYFSVVMGDCLERGKNLGDGLKYNNFGVHGACSANAADLLAAVQKFVFDEKIVTAEELLKALEADFEGYEDIQKRLIEDGPKVGNNDDRADGILVRLFDYFADACEAFGENGRGGVVRPGTGSAMLYVTLAKDIGAMPDGRKTGEYFSANLAPSPLANLRGPISVLQSYSKLPYDRCWNGGPITMELSDSVFRDDESIRKVAMLIRTFAQLGCEQLQLNVLNGVRLLEAKEHPELHRNLIVRVWGWSGYFVELPPQYQDQVIKRHLLATGA
jgi:formate C-acetyltransferase